MNSQSAKPQDEGPKTGVRMCENPLALLLIPVVEKDGFCATEEINLSLSSARGGLIND